MGRGDARHPARPHSRSPPADQRGYSHSGRGGSSTHFHPEQSGQSGQEQRAFYQDRSGMLGHSRQHESDRSLHESGSYERAPLPSGPPPASSFRDHAPSATLVLRGLAPTVNDEMVHSDVAA
ncbi:hypothetical protein BBJ28_00020979 [Nothophytophthora sp. Chile5]|nr:hypothetical protein BBJ28_00020979 [Nothophytophthora sp. Chile5]